MRVVMDAIPDGAVVSCADEVAGGDVEVLRARASMPVPLLVKHGGGSRQLQGARGWVVGVRRGCVTLPDPVGSRSRSVDRGKHDNAPLLDGANEDAVYIDGLEVRDDQATSSADLLRNDVENHVRVADVPIEAGSRRCSLLLFSPPIGNGCSHLQSGMTVAHLDAMVDEAPAPVLIDGAVALLEDAVLDGELLIA